MTKKSKQPTHKKSLATNPSRTDRLFDLIGHQIFQGDYAGAIVNSERLFSYLPQRTPQRAGVLAQMGVAHAMLQNYPQSYEAFTEALEITPNNAELWLWHTLGASDHLIQALRITHKEPECRVGSILLDALWVG